MTETFKKTDEFDTEIEETECVETDSEVDDWPTAPPLDYLEQIKGYETVSFDTSVVPPPIKLDDEAKTEQNNQNKVVVQETAPNLSPNKAKEVLFQQVSKKCCYGNSAAKQMKIEKIDYIPAFHYELQSFVEKRETNWTFAPHKGGHVDGPSQGQVPLPWEISESPTMLFKDEVKITNVPHTGVIKACHKCRGTGGITCRDCSGKGWTRCLHCHGDVYLSEGNHLGRDRCYYCQHSKHGHGQQDCTKCQAKGKVNCATCDGSAHIRCFIQLSITWKVVTAEHIVEKLNMPEDLIRDVSGQVAFEEEKQKIYPIKNFDDESIKSASALLVAKHSEKFFDSHILRQRHQIRIVPVSKVTFEWKGNYGSFFVYGYENRVYLPPRAYPQSCCWGCSIC